MAWHSKYRLDLDLFSSLGRCLCALLGDVQRWKVTEELIKVSCGWRCYILMPATTIRHQCQIITKNIKSVLLLILLVPLSQFTLGETEKNNYWGKRNQPHIPVPVCHCDCGSEVHLVLTVENFKSSKSFYRSLDLMFNLKS